MFNRFFVIITLFICRTGHAEVPFVGPLLGSSEAVTAIELSPVDGRTLIVSDQRKGVIAWDIATRKKMWSSQLPKRMYAAAFSHDSGIVALGGRYQMLSTYQLSSGKKLIDFETATEQHRTVHQVAQFSRDDRYLATVATLGDEIAAGGMFYPELHASERSKRREPDSQAFMLWNSETGKLLYSKNFSDSLVVSMGMSSDDRLTYYSSATTITVRDLQSGDILRTFKIDELSQNIEQPIFIAAAFDRSMKFLALSLVDQMIVLNVESGKIVRKLPAPAHPYRPHYLSISGTGEKLFGVYRTGPNSGLLTWDLAEGTLESDVEFESIPAGQNNFRAMISDYGQGPLVRISDENHLLIHAFPGTFSSSGSILEGGTGVILRRIP